MSTAALLDLIRSRKAVVGIIGQGYVGLPLALVFAEAGFPVVGVDLDPKKVDALNRGESYIKHIGADRVADAVKSGRFRASIDFDELKACDAVLICVPTPLGQHREAAIDTVVRVSSARVAEIDRGEVDLVPGEEVFAKIRRKYAR